MIFSNFYICIFFIIDPENISTQLCDHHPDTRFPNIHQVPLLLGSKRKNKTNFPIIAHKMAISNIHFWDDDGSATELTPVLLNPDREDIARCAWSDIASHSYPLREDINNERILWKVQRELWPGLDPGFSNLDPSKPKATVVRCVRRRRAPAAATGDAQLPPLEFDRFTWLIMEVKPPSQDTAEEWRELLLQVCSRAEKGYEPGSHDVHIICAIGLRYMLFCWDPANAGVPARALRINIAGGDETRFPSQLRPVPEASPHVPKLGMEGNPDQYLIDLDKVWSIDPRQIEAHGGRVSESFTALESFLARTRTVWLRNPRPVFD